VCAKCGSGLPSSFLCGRLALRPTVMSSLLLRGRPLASPPYIARLFIAKRAQQASVRSSAAAQAHEHDTYAAIHVRTPKDRSRNRKRSPRALSDAWSELKSLPVTVSRDLSSCELFVSFTRIRVFVQLLLPTRGYDLEMGAHILLARRASSCVAHSVLLEAENFRKRRFPSAYCISHGSLSLSPLVTSSKIRTDRQKCLSAITMISADDSRYHSSALQ
jgi:hypothetical protein